MKLLPYPDLVNSHISSIMTQMEDSGRVVLITIFCSLFTIMPVGYHIVVLNVPEQVIQQQVNKSMTSMGLPLNSVEMSVFWSVTVASQSLGALIGCGLVIPLSKNFGPKTLLMTINNYILVVGSFFLLLTSTLNFAPFLIFGRLLTGVYTGIGCAMLPLYIQEVAPKQIKGSLSCFLHIAVCFGSSISAILSLDFMLGSATLWPLLLSLPAVLGVAQIIAAHWIPDTPNHLIQGGKYTKALQAINFYYDISIEDEDEAIRQYWDKVPQMTKQMSLWDALSDRKIRWGILIGMVVSATQIFSGSMVTISYSTSMFTSVSFLAALVPFLPALGSIVSILLTLPALQLVETHGRRPLLLKTLLICLGSDIAFLVFSLFATNPGNDWWASWLFGLSFLFYGVGYNLGTGPVAYFIPSELVPAEAASASLGAAVGVNWLCTMATTLSYYPLNAAVGGWSYMMFILPSIFFLLFLWRFLPETKYYYLEETDLRPVVSDIGLAPYGTFEAELF